MTNVEQEAWSEIKFEANLRDYEKICCDIWKILVWKKIEMFWMFEDSRAENLIWIALEESSK